MRSIEYGVLAFALVLLAACGKQQEAATEGVPAPMTAPAAPAADAGSKTESAVSPAACPTGCITMNCPPPGGPVACCQRTTSGYKVCVAQ